MYVTPFFVTVNYHNMNDAMLTILITVPLAIVGFIILKVITSGIKHGFRNLLVKDRNDRRSYTQLIGVAVGKTLGKIFYRK